MRPAVSSGCAAPRGAHTHAARQLTAWLLRCACAARLQARERTDNGAELAKAAADAVMAAALDGGSTDNITVVSLLLDWGGEFAS